MSNERLCAYRLVLLGSALLFCAVIGELAVRAFRPQDLSLWDSTRDGIAIHRTNSETWSHHFGQTIRTNSLGMRDVDHAREKPDGTFRILVLGDSFMEALQVDFEDSFPAQLETEIEEAGGGSVEVMNCAVSGWGTDDELTWFSRYGVGFHPDLVLLVMTLHNDLSDNLEMRHHEFQHGVLIARDRAEPTWRFALQKAKSFMASHSHLYKLAYDTSVAQKMRGVASALNSHVVQLLSAAPSPRIDLGFALTEQLLASLDEVASSRGVRLAIVLVPLQIQTNDHDMATFLKTHDLASDALDVRRPQDRLKQWAREAGVPVIDLLDGFRVESERDGDLYLQKDGHWTPRGHALAARIVARSLAGKSGLADAGPALLSGAGVPLPRHQ